MNNMAIVLFMSSQEKCSVQESPGSIVTISLFLHHAVSLSA